MAGGDSSFGETLRSLLSITSPQLSQKNVALSLGVSSSTVSDWLHDRQRPRAHRLADLEQLLIDHGVDLAPGALSSTHKTGHQAGRPRGEAIALYPHAPAPLTPLVGREHSIQQLIALWRQHRFVCVTGPAGVGKTRLAAAVAEHITTTEVHAELMWLHMESVPSTDGVWELVALAAKAHTYTHRSVLESIAQTIGDRHATLMLDDIDHLIEDAIDAVGWLLGRCAHLHVLATTRITPDAPGIARFVVGPLATPPPGEEPATYTAVQLFGRLAAQYGQPVHDGDLAATGEVCRLLGGLPFALELAAAQLDTITIGELHHTLADQLDIPDDPAHQRTSSRARGIDDDSASGLTAGLETMLQSSWDRLSATSQQVLACASVIRGGFDLDRLATLVEMPPRQLHDAVRRLVRASMLQVDTTTDAARYSLLVPVHHFARGRLTESEQDELIHRRHAQQIADALDDAFPMSAPAIVDQFGWPDIYAALNWAIGNEPQLALVIAANLCTQWRRTMTLEAGRRWLQHSLHAAPADCPGRARAAAAEVYLRVLDDPDEHETSAAIDKALELARHDGDPHAGPLTLIARGELAGTMGRLDDVLAAAEAILATTTMPWHVASALELRGNFKLERGDATAAEDYHRMRAIAEEIGETGKRAVGELGLAIIAQRASTYDIADAHASTALRIARAGDDVDLIGAALLRLGVVAKAKQDWPLALKRFEQWRDDDATRNDGPLTQARVRIEVALAAAHTRGDDEPVDDLIAMVTEGTSIAGEHARTLVPDALVATAYIARHQLTPTDSDWLRRAAAVLTRHIGYNPNPPDPNELRQIVTQQPTTPILAPQTQLVSRLTAPTSE